MPTPRQPQQVRSRKRVEAILAATAALLREHAYPAINIGMIAARAETSVGSLYQFFPNKDAVLSALAESYARDLEATADRLFQGETADTRACVERLIEGVVAFVSLHPGFVHITRADWVSDAVRDAIARMDRQMMAGLAGWVGSDDPAANHAAARILYGAIGAILPYIEQADEEARARLILQLKRIVAGGIAAAREAAR
jgi:AcrR family transcriptional regulator